MEAGQEKEKSQEIMPLFSLLFDLVLEMEEAIYLVSSDLSKVYKTIPIVLFFCQRLQQKVFAKILFYISIHNF